MDGRTIKAVAQPTKQGILYVFDRITGKPVWPIPERKVEKGTAPSIIIASKFEGQDRTHAKMTRPLCPYPQSAKYKGSGDPNDAANFECERPKK